MNARHVQRLLFLGLVLHCPAPASSAEPPRIAHNPFSRPPSAVLDSVDIESTSLAEAPELIQLNATMVARGSQLANVEGQILRPGDDFKGYTLRFVYEDRAVFERGTRRITVFVKPDLDHEENERQPD